MFKLLVLAVAAVPALYGCATRYQADGFTGGFSETQLDRNVFRVSFEGNGFTKVERAQDFALLRSAELTLKNGYTHFAIMDANASRDYVGSVAMPSQSYTTGSAWTTGGRTFGSAQTTTTPGPVINVSRPMVTNTIMLFNGRPDIPATIYDAKFVCGSLGKKYRASCGA